MEKASVHQNTRVENSTPTMTMMKIILRLVFVKWMALVFVLLVFTSDLCRLILSFRFKLASSPKRETDGQRCSLLFDSITRPITTEQFCCRKHSNLTIRMTVTEHNSVSYITKFLWLKCKLNSNIQDCWMVFVPPPKYTFTVTRQ